MNATPEFLASGRLHDSQIFAETSLALMEMQPGDALPYHVMGHGAPSAGAFAAIADCEALGMCRHQRLNIDGRVVFVAIRTEPPPVQGIAR